MRSDVVGKPSDVKPMDTWWRDVPSGLARPRRKPRLWLPVGLLVLAPCVVSVVGTATDADRGMPERVLILLAIGLYSACYLSFPYVLPRTGLAGRAALCLIMLALGWSLIGMLGLELLLMLAFATSMVAFALPVPHAVALDGATLLAIVVVLLSLGRFGENLPSLVSLAAITVAMFLMSRLTRVVRSLREAQGEIAALAVAAERERVARDLHDILGHSLTTIAVKAGLARRVLETGNDTGRAATEIGEVESLARGALSDVRATVSQYREMSLPAELAGARSVLLAAGIEPELPQAVDDVRPDLRGVFGYVLREAVTNVVRHGEGTSRVRVRLGEDFLDVDNDGPPVRDSLRGNGLSGLAERLAAVGGELDAAPKESGGFLVRATVRRSPVAPAPSAATNPAASGELSSAKGDAR